MPSAEALRILESEIIVDEDPTLIGPHIRKKIAVSLLYKVSIKFKFKIGLLSDVQNTQYRSISISRVKHFGAAS